jgi:hypothetical protein
MSLDIDGGMILTGETEELGEKPCPSATFSHQAVHSSIAYCVHVLIYNATTQNCLHFDASQLL